MNKNILLLILLVFIFNIASYSLVSCPKALARISDGPIFTPGDGGQVEGSISRIKNKVLVTFIPLIAVLMMVIGCLFWMGGHPKGREYFIGCLIASALAFLAEPLIRLLVSLVG